MENKVYGTFNTKFALSVGGTDSYHKLTVTKNVNTDDGLLSLSADVTTGNKMLDASLCAYILNKGKYEIWIDFRKVTLQKDNNRHEFEVANLIVGIPSASAILVDLKPNTEDNNYKNQYKSWLLCDVKKENLIHEIVCK